MRLMSALCVALLSTTVTFAAQEDKELAAEEAARDWLVYVDEGEYATSWRDSGELFRQQVASHTWEDSATSAREPLGEVNSRELRVTQYTTDLPGAPDGEYVIVQFDSSFENKKSGVETVTLALEEDDWRVIGYFIQ